MANKNLSRFLLFYKHGDLIKLENIPQEKFDIYNLWKNCYLKPPVSKTLSKIYDLWKKYYPQDPIPDNLFCIYDLYEKSPDTPLKDLLYTYEYKDPKLDIYTIFETADLKKLAHEDLHDFLVNFCQYGEGKKKVSDHIYYMFYNWDKSDFKNIPNEDLSYICDLWDTPLENLKYDDYRKIYYLLRNYNPKMIIHPALFDLICKH